jgi:alpha-L-fucosidase
MIVSLVLSLPLSLLGVPALQIPKPETAAAHAPTETPEEYAERMKWFTDARFGMFIHWGPVSLTGHEIGWSRETKTPREEYDSLYKEWNPKNFDADAWAKLAADAGMRYLVLTTKHHDGFCLWDSDQTDYDIMEGSFGRDVVAELAAACERHGVRFCAYYSVLDWHHPHYTPQNMKFGGAGEKLPEGIEPDMDQYVSYLKKQVAELVTRHDPGVIWFDGEWEKPWSVQRGEDLYAYLRKLDPDLIMNNRVGKGRTAYQDGNNPGDYDTPEQKIGIFQNQRPWETCMTIAKQWAWKPDDPTKSLKQCIQTLVRCASGDGNLLFNVGPMPDGTIEPLQVSRLQEMGAWLKQNGETIYGTRGGPWRTGRWGGATYRGNTVWLHVLNWTGDALTLPAFQQKIVNAQLRASGVRSSRKGIVKTSDGAVKWKQSPDGTLRIQVSRELRDAVDTIVELTLAEPVNQLAMAGEEQPDFLSLPGAGTWISKGATFKASSTSKWDHPENHKRLTSPGGQGLEFAFHTNMEENPWIVIDLGKNCKVSGLEIGNRVGYEDRAATLRVSISQNGKAWKPVWNAKEARPRWEIPFVDRKGELVRKAARYVRLETENAEHAPLHLRYVRIFGHR